MIRIASLLLSITLFALAGQARAFTPESGWWWNPDEPGYGVSIEIQDTRVFLAIYTYNSTGSDRQSKWYVAQGLLTDNAHFLASFPTSGSSSENYFYTSRNGTCLGCPWTQFEPDLNDNPGTLEIQFHTTTTGEMTWGGRTVPIQRHDFGLSPDPNIAAKTELWLGEWNSVIDLYEYGGEAADFPFIGDVWVFNEINRENNVDYFDGCRPENSLVGVCDQFAYDNHAAYGYLLCESCGLNGSAVNIVLVQDSFVGNTQHYFVFEVEVGTSQFQGYGKLCSRADALSVNVISRCLDNDATYPVLPVRGWRSASRAFVEGDPDAPNAQAPNERTTGKRGEPRSILSRPNLSGHPGSGNDGLAASKANRAERSPAVQARAAAAMARFQPAAENDEN